MAEQLAVKTEGIVTSTSLGNDQALSLVSGPGWLRPALWITVGVAFGLQLWMWSKSWFYFDQVILYRLATDLVPYGELHPYAKGLSGDAFLPGSLLQLLLGAALKLWFDFRSPTLWLVLLHWAATPLLFRSMNDMAGTAPARLLTILWLASPWRLYHGAFLWEPNLLLLLAPVHFWVFGCLRTRGGSAPDVPSKVSTSRWWPSLVLGLMLTAAPQLHPSGLILLVASVALVASRQMRPHWGMTAVGTLAGATTLVGTFRLLLSGDLPQLAGSGRLNLLQFDAFKPLAFWIRLPAGDVGRRIKQSEIIGAEAVATAAVLFMLVALIANWALWRRFREGGLSDVDRYAVTVLLSSLFTHAFARTNPQGWHSLIVLLPSLLPLTMYLITTTPRARRFWTAGLLLMHAIVMAWITAGHPMYQRPTDEKELAAAAPERLPFLELVPIPFGSGKENWDAARRDLARGNTVRSEGLSR